MSRIPRPTWLRYVVALVAVFAVMQLRLYLDGRHLKGIEGPPFTMMFLAVIASALFGGLGPGVLATIAGAAVCDYMFIEPKGILLSNSPGYDIRLGLFIIEGLFVSWLIQALRRSSAAGRQMERNLRLIADNTSDVIFAYDMAGQLLYVNPAFEELTGNSVSELRENPFMNYVHPDDSQRMQERFGSLFQGRSFKDEEYRIIAHDGEVKWCRATWGPLVDEFGNQVGVQGRETDITEQRQSESTLQFLSDTCAVLAAGFTGGAAAGADPVATTLGKLARAAVPQYADWCMIDLIGGGGGGDDGGGGGGAARTIAAAHADASKQPWLDEIRRDYPPRLGVGETRGKVLATGQPVILSAVSAAALQNGAKDERHLKLLHNLAPKSMLIVPLRRGERVLGAITFASVAAQRRYGADDLIFATDLARRVAEFLDAASRSEVRAVSKIA